MILLLWYYNNQDSVALICFNRQIVRRRIYKMKRMKKMKNLFYPIGLVAILSLGACANGEAATPTIAPERIIPVNIAPVGTGNIQSELSYVGIVRPAEHIAIMSRLMGMVDEVFVDTGDFVNQGDVLFTMDPIDLQNNINSLEAQLAAAETAVTAARTGVAQAGGSAVQQQILQASGGITQAETGIAQAEAALAQAQTNVEQAALGLSQAQNAYNTARQNYNDTYALFSAGVATRMQMDQAEMGLSNARIGLEQATNNHNIAEIGISQAQTSHQQALQSHQQALQSHQLVSGSMPAENRRRAQDGLSQAIAQRNSLLVNLEAARERIDDAAITSPISGVIASRNIEPSTMLGQQAPPFTIISAETVQVSVDVTEVIINSIEVGQEVAVQINAASATPFFGYVTVVSPAANEITSTFAIEVSLDNRDGIIRPGMFAEVYFIRERSQNAIIVPRSAVLVEDGETVVYLAQNNRAERRPVVTGIDSGAEIEIIEGLNRGDPLIVTGQTLVTDGVALYIVEGAEGGAAQ